MKKLGVCLLSGTMLVSSMGMAGAATHSTIAGQDRFETASKIADLQGSYSTAILVNGLSLSDGLSASSLSKKYNAPILLVKEHSVPKVTMDSLKGVNKVFIIGGKNVISAGVEEQLKHEGMAVERLAGSNRVKTSIAVAREVGNYDEAFVVNGYKGEADAMSVAPVAAKKGAPILITDGKTAPTFRDSDINYYSVGGEAVVSSGLSNYYKATRIAGSNRYKTNKAVINRFYPNTDKLYVANGETLVDALTVAPLAKYNGVVLTSKNSDKAILEGKELVSVGGNVYTQGGKPDEEKPEGNPNDSNTPGIDPSNPDNKPNSDEGNKPNPNPNPGDEGSKPTPKPDPQEPEATVNDFMKPEVQKAARDEFYRLLDAHRAKNHKTVAHHVWQLEESTAMKSKWMADTGNYTHEDDLDYPHFMGGAECIGSFYVDPVKVTTETGKQIGREAFNQWLKSSGHNKILLNDLDPETAEVNNLKLVDGFGFYPRKGYSTWRIYTTYHQADSASVK